ncbi:helix-turn-helix transcriptional regulator [Streptomyces sp. MRC013]|uniref:helix-turn-helix domain-containing protein n=1 Tax=Streptomyces sp. MRC013 TaxID=2898276 RepID=UPI0020263C26|nr:helix-turn-helix transcriptional regulator [Streptomyces sp. MRC013]URM91267.1 helix-turn-helix transcriptional regulator [Streptomyces sp. MRC013]
MTATVTDGTDPAATPLAASLRRLRRQSGWSQARLAAELGYHHSVVSRWEAGARKPSLAVVRRIDHVLDTGGELARYWAGADGGRSRTPPREEPLPGLPGPSRGGEGPQVVPDHAPWPVRLPHHGVDCPLHPSAHCAVPPDRTGRRDPPRLRVGSGPAHRAGRRPCAGGPPGGTPAHRHGAGPPPR